MNPSVVLHAMVHPITYLIEHELMQSVCEWCGCVYGQGEGGGDVGAAASANWHSEWSLFILLENPINARLPIQMNECEKWDLSLLSHDLIFGGTAIVQSNKENKKTKCYFPSVAMYVRRERWNQSLHNSYISQKRVLTAITQWCERLAVLVINVIFIYDQLHLLMFEWTQNSVSLVHFLLESSS